MESFICKKIYSEVREVVATGEFIEFSTQEIITGEFPESTNQRQPIKYELVIGELNDYERALCTLMSHDVDRCKLLIKNDVSSGIDESRESILLHFVYARKMLFGSIRRRYKETAKGMILDIRQGFKVVLLPGVGIVFNEIAGYMSRQYAMYAPPR